MEPFDDDGLLQLQMDGLFVKVTLAAYEIKAGQADVAALLQFVDLLVKQGDVDCPQGFEIVAAVGIFRRVLAVVKVIVQRYLDGPQPYDAELRRQSLAERRLARRRRAGDEDDLDLRPLADDVVGNFSQLLFLQRFGHIDDILNRFVGNIAV